MKKAMIILIIICCISILTKFFISNYSITYKVDGYSVKTNYNNGRFYYEINGKFSYNFDYYAKRNLKKSTINNIVEINGNDFNCIYPVIDDVSTYPLCIKNNEHIDYHLIDSDLLDEYKEETINIEKSNSDFVYYNNLGSNTYIALWNYKGYTIMNNESYKNINLFDKDRYDNSLAYLLNDTIYMPNYNEEHEYSSIITLNITNNKKSEIKLENNIDYDSYVVGSIKNKLYIFDNKYSILYEINVKNSKVNIIGSTELGYIKYENNEFVNCSKSEYKVNKIKYNDNSTSNYTYKINAGLYKTINDNINIKTKILNDDVTIIKEYQNKLYYIYKDYLYIYEPDNGSSIVFYNYELNFNKDNTVFVYNN